jgi:nucleotide-binding universal stress UspA family protein
LIEEKNLKILVAIDGSEISMKAADYAISLADKYNSKLIALHVIDIPSPEVIDLDVREESPYWLNSIGERARAQRIQFESKIVEGAANRIGEIIVSYAEKEKIDLIVVGTRGRSGIKRMLLGSVASDVVHYAHCPVTIVK